jgi:hypothetical protein
MLQTPSTDPETFSIYLVNQNTYPNVETLIASNVDTSKGHYTMKAQDSIDEYANIPVLSKDLINFSKGADTKSTLSLMRTTAS